MFLGNIAKGLGRRGGRGASAAAAGGSALLGARLAATGFFKRFIGSAKLVVTGGVLSQLPSLFSNTNDSGQALNDSVNNLKITRPELSNRPQVINDSDVNVSAATLAFTKFVKNETEAALAVSDPPKPQLPELKPSRKYSPLFANIIENINGIKERIIAVEEKTEVQETVLKGLQVASMSLNTVVKKEMDDDRRRTREQVRATKEFNLEQKGIGRFEKAKDFIYDNTFRKAKDYIDDLKSVVVGFIKQFALPAGLLSIGALVEFANAINETEETEEGAQQLGSTSKAALTVTGALQGARSAISRTFAGGSMGQKRSMVQNIRRMQEITRKLSTSENFFIKNGVRISGITKFAAAAYLFGDLLNMASSFEKGEMSEEEYEIKAKKQLTLIVEQIGGTLLGAWLGAYVGGIAGAYGAGFVGALAVAVIGGAIGGIYGEELLRKLGTEKVVNALYDLTFGETGSLNALWNEIMKLDTYSPEQMRERGYDANLTPAQLTIAAGSFRIINNEDGTMNTLRTLKTLGTAVSVDDRALFTAFADVDSPDEYYQIKREVEANMSGDRTLEDFISHAMSENRVGQFMSMLKTSMEMNPDVSQSEINQFLNDISTNSEVFKAALPEQYDLIQRGQAIPVILSDGSRSILTADEIESIQNMSDVTRSSLLDSLERQQRNYRRYLEREARSNAPVPLPSISDEVFDENRIMLDNNVSTDLTFQRLRDRGVSIVPMTIPIMMPQMNPGSAINQSIPMPANPNPTHVTSDSFLDLRYVT